MKFSHLGFKLSALKINLITEEMILLYFQHIKFHNHYHCDIANLHLHIKLFINASMFHISVTRSRVGIYPSL